MSWKTKRLAPLHLLCHRALGLNWKMNLLVWNTYLAQQQAHKGVIQRTSEINYSPQLASGTSMCLQPSPQQIASAVVKVKISQLPCLT